MSRRPLGSLATYGTAGNVVEIAADNGLGHVHTAWTEATAGRPVPLPMCYSLALLGLCQ